MNVTYVCDCCGQNTTTPVECVMEEFRDKLQVLSFCSFCGSFNYPFIQKK